MVMNISGSGKIPAGEYEKISVSGSGRLYGHVRSVYLKSSGSLTGESLECIEGITLSGSSAFSGEVKAETIWISGSFSCDENVTADGNFICSGSAKCKKNLETNKLKLSGSLDVGEDIEAENVKAEGTLCCAGLLNADTIEIKFDKGMIIGSIGGSNISIIRNKRRKIAEKLPLFSPIIKKINRSVYVETSIEGDEILLEDVTCPRVTGRVVIIGKGCEVDLVQYSECVEISPDAMVGKTEKI